MEKRKTIILTIGEKNRVINNIIEAMVSREKFLILGHQNPDEDCIASMVAFAILLSKFYKDAAICLGDIVHEHFQYLLNICKYNSIRILESCDGLESSIDTVIICDTPKPSMIEKGEEMHALLYKDDVLKIEIDHHIGADSTYIGSEGYCLVTEATSSSELIGHIVLKLRKKRKLLEQYHIKDPFSRNLILSILTGIIGDTHMGQFLKSRRERRYYRLFSSMLNRLLSKETIKKTNFKDMDEVFHELHRLSSKERICFEFFMERKKFSPSICYITLDEDETLRLFREMDNDTVVTVARAVADELAEMSGRLSLVAYYDNPEKSDLIQFRVRRSQAYKKYDLRRMLELFSIKNGGGHEGAIGFRIPRGQIGDYPTYINSLIQGLEEEIPK